MDLPTLFRQLYATAFTPKQVVAGFSRAGVWPFDSRAMKDKVARPPLASRQIDQLAQTTSSTNLSTSSTQCFVVNNATPFDMTTPKSPSSLYSRNQNRSSLMFDVDSSGVGGYIDISLENEVIDAPAPLMNNDLTFMLEFPSASSSSEIMDVIQLLTRNQNYNAPHSSSSNPFDLLEFSSSTLEEESNLKLSSDLNSFFDKSNNSTVPIDENRTSDPINQSTDDFSIVSNMEIAVDDEDDEQVVIGFNPHMMPKTSEQYSHHSNGYQRVFKSIFDLEKDGNEDIRMNTGPPSVDTLVCVTPSKTSQVDSSNLRKQTIHLTSSNQLSPSTAVRSIVANVFRQCASNPLPLPKATNKRAREEGKYGEEITSSNRLELLKEKKATSNPKRRKTKPTTPNNTVPISSDAAGSTITIGRKKRRLSKNKNGIVSSSQATRAIATLIASSSTNRAISPSSSTSLL